MLVCRIMFSSFVFAFDLHQKLCNADNVYVYMLYNTTGDKR